jgi:hypothetical protein
MKPTAVSAVHMGMMKEPAEKKQVMKESEMKSDAVSSAHIVPEGTRYCGRSLQLGQGDNAVSTPVGRRQKWEKTQ